MIRIGIDEVGRGPLAGPVVVCGFVSFVNETELLTLFPKGTLKDSKKLTEKWRESISASLHELQKEGKVSFVIAERSAQHIDSHGIAVSIRECVHEIGEKIIESNAFTKNDTLLLLDGGLQGHESFSRQETIIKGDEKVIEISCASIVAKTYRDSYMKQKGTELPLYMFEKHMGYGTEAHRKAIQNYGPIEEHRLTFLKNILKNEK